MYHPIHRLDCEPQLKKLNDLARLTIAFGLENDDNTIEGYQSDGKEPQQQILVNLLGDEFLNKYGGLSFLTAVRASFIEYFENRDAGEWLWSKQASIAVPVVQLLVIPKSEKQNILQAFDEDLNLDACISRGLFRYSTICNVNIPALNCVNSIIHNFYTEILGRSGVPANVMEYSTTFNRRDVLSSFIRTNRKLKVCPGCDGSPPAISGGVVHEDIDHFFPKSKYPFLAIHPLNLTPYCKYCNQTYKRDKDVLDSPGVANLTDIYHPYLRPARDEVQIIIERNRDNGKPHLYLRSNCNDSKSTVRLNSLKYLLELEARWQGDLIEERLAEHMERAFRYATQDDREKLDFQPDDDWIHNKLSRIAADMKCDIGRDPGAAPAQAYVKWASSDSEICSQLLQLFLSYKKASSEMIGGG